MLRERPPWLTEPCPTWCRVDHQDQSHRDDRYHQSRQILVPVIVPRPEGGGEGDVPRVRTPETSDMAVVVLRSVGPQGETWLAVVGERQFIEVSVESSIRLHAALGEILDEVR